METSERSSRFLFVNDPKSLSPFSLADQPLVSFADAIAPLSSLIKNIDDMAYTCLEFATELTLQNGMTPDEAAALNLYTREWVENTQDSFYYILNQHLRDPDRKAIRPYFPYLRLVFEAIGKLPISGEQHVFRGIKVQKDLPEWKENDKLRWWSFGSTSASLSTVSQFVGDNSIIFNIKTRRGYNISAFSLFPREQEVLVIPPVQFIVKGVGILPGNVKMIDIEEDETFPLQYFSIPSLKTRKEPVPLHTSSQERSKPRLNSSSQRENNEIQTSQDLDDREDSTAQLRAQRVPSLEPLFTDDSLCQDFSISREELTKIKDLFNTFDSDQSGTITLLEVIAGIITIRGSMTATYKESLEKLMKQCSTDGDGKDLNLKQFVQFYQSYKKLEDTQINTNPASPVPVLRSSMTFSSYTNFAFLDDRSETEGVIILNVSSTRQFGRITGFIFSFGISVCEANLLSEVQIWGSADKLKIFVNMYNKSLQISTEGIETILETHSWPSVWTRLPVLMVASMGWGQKITLS